MLSALHQLFATTCFPPQVFYFRKCVKLSLVLILLTEENAENDSVCVCREEGGMGRREGGGGCKRGNLLLKTAAISKVGGGGALRNTHAAHVHIRAWSYVRVLLNAKSS